jgi:hypothetical protein
VKPHLLAEVSFGTITCLSTLNLAFDDVSSSVVTCPMAPGSAFLTGELRCSHVSHGSGLCLP